MPTKKKTENKGESKPPKIPRPPIPEEMIYRLIDRYSAPLQTIPDDSTASIWATVAELKGWMVKKGRNNALGSHVDPHNFANVFINIAWQKLRGILDDAVVENTPTAFDELSKAWQQWEISKPPPRLNKSGAQADIDPWKKNEDAANRKLAENIENLITPLPTNNPNSPRKIEFLEAVLNLQRKWERAPTRREIEDRTEITKNKVSEMVGEMELGDLLSLGKRTKSP